MKVEMIYLSQEDVIRCGGMSMDKAIDDLEEVFRLYDKGDYILPGKIVMKRPEPNAEETTGRINAMPGYIGGRFNMPGIKWDRQRSAESVQVRSAARLGRDRAERSRDQGTHCHHGRHTHQCDPHRRSNGRLRQVYAELQQGIKETVSSMIVAILILLAVGVLVGTWMASGTVPVMIYYGMKVLTPGLFLPVVCILCTLMSTMAGTSWGTLATVGVACMGVAQGLGVPLPAAAGAVCTGAFFGDKVSPLPDSPVITATVCEVPLMDGIRHALISTGPAYLISLVFYFVWYKISIVPEADMKPRRLCLFLL